MNASEPTKKSSSSSRSRRRREPGITFDMVGHILYFLSVGGAVETATGAVLVGNVFYSQNGLQALSEHACRG